MDVYTTSSSSATPTTSSSGQSQSSSSSPSGQSEPSAASGDWSTDQSADPQSQWATAGSFPAQQSGRQQPSRGNFRPASNQAGLSAQFDLVNGGDPLSSLATGRAHETDRQQRQRTVRAPGRQLSATESTMRNQNTGAGSTEATVPSVPSSTTTAAPEYVMINPTRGGADTTSDQDD